MTNQLSDRLLSRFTEPRSQLRIGVTGHRSNKLSHQDCVSLKETLRVLFEDLSSLGAVELATGAADGADLVAMSARPRDWGHLAILAEPVIAFRTRLPEGEQQLWDNEMRNARVVEVSKTTPDYEAVARHLIHSIDVLIAVWDGKPGKPGGTGSVVELALSHDLPVIHIPFPLQSSPRLLGSSGEVGSENVDQTKV